MNSISLLNLSFWEKVATIFDILPKTIYFLYACLASAVDAMQSLVRKLAGLDTYFRADTGAAVTGTDPLSEFVYGILGFGENSSIYEALNTVFWSLAIFGLIVLVLTTMVAIIKSHYSEDSTQTNPWKYIYTAIKSLLTFVILPVIVVIGLQLSSFVLRTLDNITAGAGNEDELTSMYGDASVNRLKSAETADGKKTYAYYDMFGAKDPSTNTTFSGMMFNACMYSANRARTGAFGLSYFTSGRGDGVNSLMDGFFAKGPEYDALSDSDAKLEFVAGQVDYAFANCLQFNSGVSYASLKGQAGDAAPVAGWSDWYGASKSNVDGFSKYDVATIWIFYDLWQFNMIVGYAGVFVTFAIMISIVVGLMSRLIKGAALFLVYPSILGIAPLDDFKAFKSWSNEFIKQILSAFGAIVGLNLLFLILPYVQQISFFDIGLLDAIVNCVFLITGLIMAKDFISMVAGFVGGGDVFSTGDGAKGQVAKTMGTGIKAAVGAGAGVIAAGVGIVAAADRLWQRHDAKNTLKNLNTKKSTLSQDVETKQEDLEIAENQENIARANAESKWQNNNRFIIDAKASKDKHLEKTLEDARNAAYKKAKDAGKSDFEANREASEAAYAAADKELESKDVTWRKKKKSFIDSDSAVQTAVSDTQSKRVALSDAQNELEEINKDIKNTAHDNYLNEDGSSDKDARRAMARNIAAQSLGPLKLFAKDISANLNVDKLAGQFKTLALQATGRDAQGNEAIKSKEYTPKKYKGEGEARDLLGKQAEALGYAKGSADYNNYINSRMAAYEEKLERATQKAIERAISNAYSPLRAGENRGTGAPNLAGEKLQKEQLKATQAQTETTKKQSDKIDKLIETMESFVKKAGGGTP